MTSRGVLLVSLLCGIALELGTRAASGRREAWDSADYWIVGIPLVLAVSFVAGLLSKPGAWRWTAAVIPSQVLTMVVGSGEFGGLWPLTVALSAMLSAPFVAAAFFGSRLRRAFRSS